MVQVELRFGCLFWATAARSPNLLSPPPRPTPCVNRPPAADWKQRTVLHFRVQRKQALRQTLERLASALGISYGGTAADPVPQHVRDEL